MIIRIEKKGNQVKGHICIYHFTLDDQLTKKNKLKQTSEIHKDREMTPNF